MIAVKFSILSSMKTAHRPRIRRLGVGGGIFVLTISICYYFISLFLLDKFVRGDRISYNLLYAQLSISDFSEIGELQRIITGSGELLYGITIWIASRWLPNDVFLSIVNATMCAMLVVLLAKHRAPLWLIVLILANFYLIVLITSAERLKFSVFMLLAATMMRARAAKLVFLGAAPLFHMQTLIYYLALLVGAFFEGKDLRNVAGRFNKPLFIGCSILCLGLLFLWKRDYILMKFSGYSDYQGELLQIAALTAISFLTFRPIAHPTISLIALWLPVYVLGESRVNMIGCMVYLYYCIRCNKLDNPFLGALLVYFAYKSVGFIESTIKYGNGFVND